MGIGITCNTFITIKYRFSITSTTVDRYQFNITKFLGKIIHDGKIIYHPRRRVVHVFLHLCQHSRQKAVISLLGRMKRLTVSNLLPQHRQRKTPTGSDSGVSSVVNICMAQSY